MNRIQKQIFIVVIFFLLILALLAVFYFWSRPAMSCHDGKRNQGETGVDCGGPCAPCVKKINLKALQVLAVERADDGQGKEDLVVTILNPNEHYGVADFSFKIVEKRQKINQSASYHNFILPKQKKHIIINHFKPTEEGAELEVLFDDNFDWRRISGYPLPRFMLYNKQLRLFDRTNFYAELTGLLVNKSNIDYEEVKVKGILRDENGKLVAASYQIVNTLKAGEEREFHIIFPNQFSRPVKQTFVEAETNIFDSDNYPRVLDSQINYIDE